MSRFWGTLGIYSDLVTSTPGVVKRNIVEVEVTGEMRNQRVSHQQGGANKKLSTQHVLSIVTPEDSEIDFTEVVYVVWMGRNWSVTGIQYKRPRLELSLGGLYNNG